MQKLTSFPLRLAVVGHTNTGKTSLLRTLTRDTHFGEVRNSPGTTRHVEGVRLTLADQELIELFDTPGLEDSMALLDFLERLDPEAQRLDGPERVAAFLRTPEATGRFEQEARVLRQLLECDAGLYVVDVRDPVLAKHKDELRVLANCGKPLLPVLNFVRSPDQRIEQWRVALANNGLHAQVEFDTVAPALNGEAELYDKLSMLLSGRQSQVLQKLSLEVEKQRHQRLQDAWLLLAELLIDVAAWRVVSPAKREAVEQNVRHLHETISRREQACVRSLLSRFNFSSRDYMPDHIALEGHRWETNLFHPDALKEWGIKLSKGVAAGAMAGATFDLLTAGLSLGAGTLIGAAAGGVWQGVDKWGQRLLSTWRGESELSADDKVLRVLALRQIELIKALATRGHAAQTPIAIDGHHLSLEKKHAPTSQPVGIDWRTDAMPEALMQARAFPEWSTMHPRFTPSSKRTQAVQQLTSLLAEGAGFKE